MELPSGVRVVTAALVLRAESLAVLLGRLVADGTLRAQAQSVLSAQGRTVILAGNVLVCSDSLAIGVSGRVLVAASTRIVSQSYFVGGGFRLVTGSAGLVSQSRLFSSGAGLARGTSRAVGSSSGVLFGRLLADGVLTRLSSGATYASGFVLPGHPLIQRLTLVLTPVLGFPGIRLVRKKP